MPGWASGLVVLIVLVGCHDTGRAQSAATPRAPAGVVPFVARAADLSAGPAPAVIQTPTAPAPRSPGCHASQLAVAWSGSNGATGTTMNSFDVRNVSGRACRVGDMMMLVVRTASGRRIAAHAMPGFLGDRVVPADLPPGATASSALLTFNACQNYDGGAAGAVMSAGVELVVGDVAVPMGQPNGRAVNVRCRPGVEPLGRHLGQPTPVTAGTVYALAAQLVFSGAARAGTVVWPLLRLRNPSGDVVRLSPCPSYMIGLAVVGTQGPQFRYRLNCAVVTSIAPGQTVTYQLRVPVPRQAGAGKLYWQMLPRTTNPPLPAAALAVRIV